MNRIDPEPPIGTPYAAIMRFEKMGRVNVVVSRRVIATGDAAYDAKAHLALGEEFCINENNHTWKARAWKY